MLPMNADIRVLSNILIDEIFKAIGFSPVSWTRRKFGSIFAAAADRLASLGIGFDRQAAQFGFSRAAQWILPQLVKDVAARGAENIPAEGPLLVVSNHPGTYDALAIAAHLRREDLKIVVGNMPFLRGLSCADRYFIFTTLNPYERMKTARSAILHLTEGGALLIFPSGSIDPDPAVFPDAQEHIERWYPSIDLFLRRVPDAKLLLTIVSGVLSRYWGYHPLTWLRKQGLDKRRLAEFGQVIQQLLTGKRMPAPSVSFATPLSVEELRRESGCDRLLPAIIARGKAELEKHVTWASSF